MILALSLMVGGAITACGQDTAGGQAAVPAETAVEAVSASMDEELAYHLTEILEQSAASLAGTYDFLTLMESSRFRCSDLPIPLHAGARKYYTEIGALE